MSKVFKDLVYAVQYEQINLDLDDVYGKFARQLISLSEISNKNRILDFGCGTGISTYHLCENVYNARIVGIDQSKEFLRIAKLKFGSKRDSELTKIIKKREFYPEVLKNNCEVRDLEEYFKRESKEYRKYSDRVEFQCKDASELEQLAEKEFDCVFASQVIHWLRKKDVKKEEEPNYDYEKKVLSSIRKILRHQGLFSFNTSGADFKFDDETINQKHILNHPFYKTFKTELHEILKIEKASSERIYTFDDKEIKRIMNENGFSVEGSKNQIIEYNDPRQLIEICMIGGQMEIFGKENIKSPLEEREQILKEALEKTLEKIGTPQSPIIETGIHYVTKKS